MSQLQKKGPMGPFSRQLGAVQKLHKGVDGSARKPALVQDTGYMVEKTNHISPYLGLYNDYRKQLSV